MLRHTLLAFTLQWQGLRFETEGMQLAKLKRVIIWLQIVLLTSTLRDALCLMFRLFSINKDVSRHSL